MVVYQQQQQQQQQKQELNILYGSRYQNKLACHASVINGLLPPLPPLKSSRIRLKIMMYMGPDKGYLRFTNIQTYTYIYSYKIFCLCVCVWLNKMSTLQLPYIYIYVLVRPLCSVLFLKRICAQIKWEILCGCMFAKWTHLS